jgi:hypothetical protein
MKSLEDAVRELGGKLPDFNDVPEFRIVFAQDKWHVWHELWDDSVNPPEWYEVGTVAEFHAMTDKLRNKPTWEQVLAVMPDAKWLAQGSDGGWWAYTSKPSGCGSRMVKSGVACSVRHGEVIGDWKDTLEPLPADHIECTDVWNPMQPVGTKIEVRSDCVGVKWEPAVVIAHGTEFGKACLVLQANDEVLVWSMEDSIKRTWVRPLRTDRQRAVEAALSAIDQDYECPGATPKKYVENAIIQLYDAGLLRLPEGEI